MNNCAYISALAVGIFLKWTHFTETALLILPDEIPAVRAERGLPQEGGHELVRVDLVDLALHRAPPLPRHEAALLEKHNWQTM